MSARRFPILRQLLATLLLAALANFARGQTWQASVDTAQGLPSISKGGAPAVKGDYVFWGSNWIWATTTTQFRIISPYTYGLTGKNVTLGFDLTGNSRKTAANQMVWDFDLTAAAAKSNVVGGGISFKFSTATFATEMGTPTVLPDKSGWAWGTVGGNRMEMRFSPIPANVFVEPGTNTEIRVFFYNGSIPAGLTHHTATLTLSGDMAVSPTLTERFGTPDTTAWPTDILDWRTSPVDLSFLNRPEIPAGKRGFLKAVGDRLYFTDGTVARFWGTNLTSYTLFTTSRDGVRQQARRLSQLGFNLVRIHHHDSYWVNPNIFGPSTVTDTRTLSAASLEKIDWWIKCLKDEGIYVFLDLHTQRFLKEGDRIDNFAEIAKGSTQVDLKGYNYVNASIQQAMLDFGRDYLDHLNPYTGLRYKDEPAIATIQITNENDLTHHFGNYLLPDKNVPAHSAIYMAESQKFADAWGLSREATWHSWEYGPSKLFLNDLEYRFNKLMLDDLRTRGVKVPVVTTSSWGNMPVSSLPALTAGNIVDVHSYGGVGELERSPLYTTGLMGWIATAQVAGRPLSVTEWNVEAYPAPDRHSAALYVAGNAAHQGWDAMMQFAYSQVALDSASSPSNYGAYNDPAAIATLPAAALLYRQGHVREAASTYAYTPTSNQLFYQMVSAGNSVALRTAAERGKLVVVMPSTRELPWLLPGTVPAGATVITNPQQSLLPANAVSATSDNGELQRNWDQGIYTINTPRTQAAMGWIGGRSIQLPDVTIDLTTRNATVAVQAMDGQPVRTSRNILISLGARAVPASGNRMPFYAEPVEGRLAIRAPTGMKLYKKRPDGSELEVPTTYSNGAYVVILDPSLRTWWLVLKSLSGKLPTVISSAGR